MGMNTKLKKPLKIISIIISVIFCVILIEIVSQFGYWYIRSLGDSSSLIEENQEQVACVLNAIIAYADFHGNPPNTLADLKNDKTAMKTWCVLTKDIWNIPINFKVWKDGSNTVVKVWSYGVDKKPGGDGPATDIVLEQRIGGDL